MAFAPAPQGNFGIEAEGSQVGLCRVLAATHQTALQAHRSAAVPLRNVAYGSLADILQCPKGVRFTLPAQPVDATQALNLSAGVSNCKVSRGRSLS